MCRRTFLRAKCAIVRIVNPGDLPRIRLAISGNQVVVRDVLPREIPQQLLHAYAPELVLVLSLIPDPVVASIGLHQKIGYQPGLLY